MKTKILALTLALVTTANVATAEQPVLTCKQEDIDAYEVIREHYIRSQNICQVKADLGFKTAISRRMCAELKDAMDALEASANASDQDEAECSIVVSAVIRATEKFSHTIQRQANPEHIDKCSENTKEAIVRLLVEVRDFDEFCDKQMKMTLTAHRRETLNQACSTLKRDTMLAASRADKTNRYKTGWPPGTACEYFRESVEAAIFNFHRDLDEIPVWP